MDTETQSFQPESSNPALGLQGVTTSLYAKGRRKKAVRSIMVVIIAILVSYVIIIRSGGLDKGLD